MNIDCGQNSNQIAQHVSMDVKKNSLRTTLKRKRKDATDEAPVAKRTRSSTGCANGTSNGCVDEDPGPTSSKRKREDATEEEPVAKRTRSSTYCANGTSNVQRSTSWLDSSQATQYIPRGLIWDPVDHSCAYDAFLCIMRHICHLDSASVPHQPANNIMSWLMEELPINASGYENLRDHARSLLRYRSNTLNRTNDMYPRGSSGASVTDIAYDVLQHNECALKVSQCITCEKVCFTSSVDNHCVDISSPRRPQVSRNVQPTVQEAWNTFTSLSRVHNALCSECNGRLETKTIWQSVRPLISIPLHGELYSEISETIDVTNKYQAKQVLRLQGIIYHGSHHFTVRVIDKWGNVWYNDGMAMGTQFVKERTGINLTQARSRNACLLIYH